MNIVENLDKLLINHHDPIKNWFKNHYNKVKPLIYSSVDLRHSGPKLVPVDTNIYPAGFNNLGDRGYKAAKEEFSAFLELHYPNCNKIIILTEDHTRNLPYFDNLYILRLILSEIGKNVLLGSINPELKEPFQAISETGKEVLIEPFYQATAHFKPDLIISNNDFTNGLPDQLNVLNIPVIPSPNLGWWRRKKSGHFTIYNDLAKSFCQEFDIDPFYITTKFASFTNIDFKESSNIDELHNLVASMLGNIKTQYEKYNINESPYLFIKADRGTYGMGITTIFDAKEVLHLNKKARNKLNIIKGGLHNTEVIIQEGIKTIDKFEGYSAEPMIYMVGGREVDCIYRVNSLHDEFGNLNSKGMYFEKNICHDTIHGKSPKVSCRFSVYGLIARIAALAAAYEI